MTNTTAFVVSHKIRSVWVDAQGHFVGRPYLFLIPKEAKDAHERLDALLQPDFETAEVIVVDVRCPRLSGG